MNGSNLLLITADDILSASERNQTGRLRKAASMALVSLFSIASQPVAHILGFGDRGVTGFSASWRL
ncbi:MAG TPA: hypothetical protein VNO14_08150 [Blastocatellia bacterium]|nr:hypothetical protein [Blastocatellia bacterium]